MASINLVDIDSNITTNLKKKELKYPKGISGYNLFVKENKEELGDFRNWGSSWKKLDLSTKENYIKRAKNIPRETKQILLKNLNQTIVQLQNDFAVDMVCVGHDLETQTQYVMGYGKTAEYLREKNILSELYSSNFKLTDPPVKEKSLIERRLLAQAHINALYSSSESAVIKMKHFPYKAVREGKLNVKNLPLELTPLQPPSQYGLKKLEMIMSLKEIKIEKAITSINQDNSPENIVDEITIEEDKTHENIVDEITIEEDKTHENIVDEITIEEDKTHENIVGEITIEEDKTHEAYDIEKILKTRKRKRKEEECLVKWVGYSKPTWEPKSNVFDKPSVG